jgi:hypothetical protein
MANELKVNISISSSFPASPAVGQNPEVISSPPLSVATFNKNAVGGQGPTTVSVPTTTPAGTAIAIPASVSTNGWDILSSCENESG